MLPHISLSKQFSVHASAYQNDPDCSPNQQVDDNERDDDCYRSKRKSPEVRNLRVIFRGLLGGVAEERRLILWVAAVAARSVQAT
jgi:hypothetical protein